jgi:hypothetical protein
MKIVFPPASRLSVRRLLMRGCLSLFAGLLLTLVSCTAQISGPLKAEGSAELRISAALEPRMAALIRSLAAISGSAANGPLLDGPAIAQSMSAAPGIDSVSFKNTAPATIEGQARIAKIGDFLASGAVGDSAVGERGFITFEQNQAGGHCLISLNRETGPRLLSLISLEISGYLEALMAPLATGESLSKAEYLALVSTVYGKGIADEIAQSAIRASIEFPGPVQSVRGGTFSGSRADFTIPLLDMLVLETPLSYEAVWK